MTKQLNSGREGTWHGFFTLLKQLKPRLNASVMKSTRLWRHLAVSLIAAGPAGGFLFGLLNPGDPDPNPIGRFVYACLMAVQTPLHAGFPPHDEAGGGRSFNVWPYIGFSFVLILGALVYRDWRRSKRDAPALAAP